MNVTEKESPDLLTFEASNVTGSQTLEVQVQRSLPAEEVARSVAADMALPDNIFWSLRDDQSSAFLVGDRPIGEQIAPGARISVTPRVHLGAAGGV